MFHRAPQQVLKRLPREIKQMKEKAAAAWSSATKTVAREPPIVEKFCRRIEEEVKKTISTKTTKSLAKTPVIKYLKRIQ